MTAALVAVFLVALQAPDTPLDPKVAGSLIEHAVFNTRAQKNFETSFKARFTPPEGKAIDYKGAHVAVAPSILYLAYTATGGDDQKIVRAGDDSWVYYPLGSDWTSAAERGMDGAARGILHPVEVLALIAKNRERATLLKPGVCELKVEGDALQAMLKDHVHGMAVNWKQSSARLELTVNADARVQSFSCAATLVSNAGRIVYSADVEIVSYNKTAELVFTEDKRPIPLHPAIRKAIDYVLNSKK